MDALLHLSAWSRVIDPESVFHELLLGLAFSPAEHWERFLQLLLGFDDAERISHDIRRVKARRGGARWIVLERRGELEDVVHHAVHASHVVDLPIPESIRRNVGTFVRVLHEVEYLLQAQRRERLGPDTHRPFLALLRKDILIVALAHGDEQAVVVGVEEFIAGALHGVVVTGSSFYGSEKLALVVAVEVNLVCLAVGSVPFETACRRYQARRQSRTMWESNRCGS